MCGNSQYVYCLQLKRRYFGLVVYGHFGIENHEWKISSIDQDLLNYTNFSWIISFAKLFRNPHFTYYRNYKKLLKYDGTNKFLPSYTTFHQSKMVLFLFFFVLSSDMHQSTTLLGAMLQALILCLYIFYIPFILHIYYTKSSV